MAGSDAAFDRALWQTHWHLLAHRSELAGAGRYVLFDVAGDEVAAFHDGESVQVFDNRCPHRGARIFDGTHGQSRFFCRYHAWAFAKGRFIIPGRELFDCDLSDVRLNSYRTEWLGDFLFVSRRPARALAEQLAGIAELVETISYGIGERADFNTYPYECDWKIAVENALDQYHVAVIHRDSLDKLKMEPAQDSYFGLNNISRAGVGDERVAKRLRSLRRFFDMSYQPEGYLAIHLFPFTFLTSTMGYSYSLQSFHPAASDRTSFSSRFYSGKLSSRVGPEAMRAFFDSSLQVNHQVFREDAEICARVPTDSWSPEPPRYLSSGEEKIAYFRQTMRALMRGEDPQAAYLGTARAPALVD